MATFQPSLGSGVTGEPGADVTRLFIPPQAGAPTGSGVPLAPGRPGTVMSGDNGTEFILGKLTLAAQTDLLFGQAYQLDKDYNATLLTTAGAVLQEEAVFGQLFAPATPAGTYYLWLARAGHIGVQVATGSAAGGLLESTAVAGQVKAPSTPTAGSKALLPAALLLASASFTGNTTTGSPTITGIASLLDVNVGASISGAGIPVNAVIGNIRRQGGTFAVDMVSSTALTTPLAATATATGVAVTTSGVLPCVVSWPTLTKGN